MSIGIFANTKPTVKAPTQEPFSKAIYEKSGEICPLCGGKLIVRKNSNTGALFVGCNNFPKCYKTYTMFEDTDESRGTRGHLFLPDIKTNFYFAESFKALSWLRGMKQNDIAIIRDAKDEYVQEEYVYDQGSWSKLFAQCDECGHTESNEDD